jgi:methyl-accepting chemotaxis protein
MFGMISSGDLQILDEFFENFLEVVSNKRNELTFNKHSSNSTVDRMLQNWMQKAKQYDEVRKNDMKVMGEIVITADKIEQGIYSCKINSDTPNPMIKTLIKTLNKMIDALNRDMGQLKSVVEKYTNDDFTDTVDIHHTIKADMLAVMQSINKLGETLAHNAKINLTNGEHLQANASTMKQSVGNLATKANQQAASLEETAAAVEEITSITRNNAQNASKMSELGNTVKKAVSDGSNLATQTSSAMDEINEQVSAINEAITVIDQISFQTNILSLNAAVEAATAGEAGKGFAVVAQEVRNLASRSAEAANEIKALVETASTKANQGKHISEDMLKGYEAINTHFNETIHLIENVSAASKEQMAGIEQINDAVALLDKVTQENASEANQVEEIADDVDQMAQRLVTDASTKKFN